MSGVERTVLDAALDAALEHRVELHRARQAGDINVPTYLAGLRTVRDIEDRLEPLRQAVGAADSRAWERSIGPTEPDGQLLMPADVELRPTLAIEREQSRVAQCSWCGLLACHETGEKLGTCPACGTQKWWPQDVPVGPFERSGTVAP